MHINHRRHALSDLKEVDITTLGNGVIPELFQRELAAVLANINDPNTNPSDTRKIVLEVSIKPHESREMAGVSVKCTSRISGVSPAVVAIYLAKKGNSMVALSRDPGQLDIFEKPTVIEGGNSAEGIR
jgi:hypothetical protein